MKAEEIERSLSDWYLSRMNVFEKEYAASLLDYVNRIYSQNDYKTSPYAIKTFNDSSTVSRINRGEQPALSDMYREVYELAQTVNRETYGAFDITVAPLVNAWGFGFKHSQMPTPQQVDSLLQIRSQLDYSAIAKGYGCDAVTRLLRSRGVENLMVEIGGEVVVRGQNPKGSPWRVGINQPVDDSLFEIMFCW